jgi:hypothetical protein
MSVLEALEMLEFLQAGFRFSLFSTLMMSGITRNLNAKWS